MQDTAAARDAGHRRRTMAGDEGNSGEQLLPVESVPSHADDHRALYHLQRKRGE
jgi:hypothetical protein